MTSAWTLGEAHRLLLLLGIVLVAASTFLFGRFQARPGRVGGRLARSKLCWLGFVVYLSLFAPPILAAAPEVSPGLTTILLVFWVSFVLRAAIELWLMYFREGWRASYGVAHDVLSVVLLSGGLLFVGRPIVEPVHQAVQAFIFLLGLTMCGETGFAVWHWRVTRGRTTGKEAIWFADPEAPGFRGPRRATAAALFVLVPPTTLILFLLISKRSAQRAPASGDGWARFTRARDPVIKAPTAPSLEVPRSSGLPSPMVIARMGASAYAPEATLPALVVARRLGVDFVEISVQRTLDGVLIAFQGEDLRRTTNVAALYPDRARNPPSTFAWAEIARLDAGSWFSTDQEATEKAFAGLRVLRFGEVLRILSAGPERVPGILVGTKDLNRPGTEADIVRALRRNGWLATGPEARAPRKVLFKSASVESLQRLRIEAPEVPRFLVLGANGTGDDSLTVAQALDAQLAAPASSAWPSDIRRAKVDGRFVVHHPVNRPWRMLLLGRWGSDGFSTDRPDLALQFFGRMGPSARSLVEAWVRANSRRP